MKNVRRQFTSCTMEQVAPGYMLPVATSENEMTQRRKIKLFYQLSFSVKAEIIHFKFRVNSKICKDFMILSSKVLLTGPTIEKSSAKIGQSKNVCILFRRF